MRHDFTNKPSKYSTKKYNEKKPLILVKNPNGPIWSRVLTAGKKTKKKSSNDIDKTNIDDDVSANTERIKISDDLMSEEFSKLSLKLPVKEGQNKKKIGLFNTVSYDEAVLNHLQVHTTQLGGVYKNPFRSPSGKDDEKRLVPVALPGYLGGFTSKTLTLSSNTVLPAMTIADRLDIPKNSPDNHRRIKCIEPTVYRKMGSKVKHMGSMSVLVTTDDSNDNTFQTTKVPSKNEVLRSLADVTKLTIVGYDMRIVETGALVRVSECTN